MIPCRCTLFLLTLAVLCSELRASFDFEVLQFRAKNLAAQPYKEKPSNVPASMLKYTYDQYRKIQYDRERAWWHNAQLPFELQFFHPGWLYNKTVQINELADQESSRIEFSKQMFIYGEKKPWLVPSSLGFAGLRILTTLNRPEKMDELVSFLGASYFRALGKGMHYGASARGLAINTGEPEPEEFPAFEEFWVERPEQEARTITCYALMDSPSVVGAFRFIITPGEETVMLVRTAIYCRAQPKVFGIAPLTSMFWHGENTSVRPRDFRPEVHDSDGLLLETGSGEWLWRPLNNPTVPHTSVFRDDNVRGFGLLQRDREFEHYDDLEAYYHQRPSIWVEPVGDWGPGEVRLVELATPDETNDNIIAFWKPDQLPPPGEALTLEYKLYWFTELPGKPPAGHVLSTRVADVPMKPDLKRFVIEFDSSYLNSQPSDPTIQAVLTVGPCAAQEDQLVVQKNQFTGAWRVVFELKPDGSGRPVELRCFLRKEQHVLTETWSYLWNP